MGIGTIKNEKLLWLVLVILIQSAKQPNLWAALLTII